MHENELCLGVIIWHLPEREREKERKGEREREGEKGYYVKLSKIDVMR